MDEMKRALQLTVSKRHSAVMERNIPSQLPDVAIPDSGAMPHDT